MDDLITRGGRGLLLAVYALTGARAYLGPGWRALRHRLTARRAALAPHAGTGQW